MLAAAAEPLAVMRRPAVRPAVMHAKCSHPQLRRLLRIQKWPANQLPQRSQRLARARHTRDSRRPTPAGRALLGCQGAVSSVPGAGLLWVRDASWLRGTAAAGAAGSN